MNIFERFRLYITGKPPREQYLLILRRKYEIKSELGGEIDRLPDLLSYGSIIDAERAAYKQLNSGEKLGINNSLWLRVLQSLRDTCEDELLPSKENIYIGQIPNPCFNASYIPTGNSKFLILVHGGLMLFLFRAAVLFIGSCSFRFGDERVPPVFDEYYARSEFAANLEQIFSDSHRSPFPLQSAPHLKTALALTKMLETFVVAHELGHILNHGTDFTSPEEEEFNADNTGYNLYRKTLPDFIEHECADHKDLIIRSLHAAAPHMFFHLGTLLELFAPPNLQYEDTHPPASERSKRLWHSQQENQTETNTIQLTSEVLTAFSKVTTPNRILTL